MTDLQKELFYRYPPVMPISLALIPYCKVAEQQRVDFYPGLFLRIQRRNLKDQPRWMQNHAKQEIVRAFNHNVKEGIFAPWISVSKRGQKRKLYKLTPKGETILRNLPAHLQHYSLTAQEDLMVAERREDAL
jgi:hypothetical protein